MNATADSCRKKITVIFNAVVVFGTVRDGAKAAVAAVAAVEQTTSVVYRSKITTDWTATTLGCRSSLNANRTERFYRVRREPTLADSGGGGPLIRPL